MKTRSSSLKPANSGPSKELEPSKTGPVRRDSGPGWQDRPVPISPHIGKHSKWRQTAPWLGSKEVGPPPWAQDELCYRNTTCLLHFLLKQDTLHPPDQSAQHGSREEAPGTRRPHPGWPFRGGGCGHILGPWAQLPPVLLWGDKHVVSEGLGASFHSLTWSASLQCMVFCAHLAKLSFCCSEPQGSHLTQVSLWNCIICTLS